MGGDYHEAGHRTRCRQGSLVWKVEVFVSMTAQGPIGLPFIGGEWQHSFTIGEKPRKSHVAESVGAKRVPTG